MTANITMLAEQLQRAVPGGIGTYVRGLAMGLRQQKETDISLSFIASAPRAAPDPLSPYGNVRALPFPSRLLTRIWERDHLRGPAWGDLVHATSFAFPAPRRRKPIPLSVFVHDLAWRRFPESYPKRGIAFHERGLERALEYAQFLLVPSADTATDLLAAGADPAKVHVVGEGCDHLPSNRGDGWGKALLSVSTLEPRKNLGRLIEAYARIRPSLPEPWPLRIVGPKGWDGHGADGLPATLPDGIELVGAVSDFELADLYANSRAFGYVPLVEGFGLPPLEAMRSGLPVVCSDVPSARLPGEVAALVVDPTDVDAIASALFRALTDDPLRAELRKAGLKLAAQRTWRAAAVEHLRAWALQ